MCPFFKALHQCSMCVSLNSWLPVLVSGYQPPAGSQVAQWLKKKKKKSTYQCRRHRFHPGVGKNPWRRKWQPTPVFLPGESHGQRSLAGYSPWDHKESDTTERLSMRAIYIKAQMVPEAASGALQTASESFGHTLLMLCALSHFHVQNAAGSACAFLAPILQSAISPRPLAPFSGEWYLEAIEYIHLKSNTYCRDTYLYLYISFHLSVHPSPCPSAARKSRIPTNVSKSTAIELILLFSLSIFVTHFSLDLPGPGPLPGADSPPQGEPPQGLTPHSGPPTPTDTLLTHLGPTTPGLTILHLDVLLTPPDLQHLHGVDAASPHRGFDTTH